MTQAKPKALIIGCSSPGGLGEAVAERLAKDGCEVVVAARSESRIAELAATLGGRHLACDIRDEASIADMCSAAAPFDILINAAGTTCAGGLSRIERTQLEDQMELHYVANALLLKHALPAMPDGGSIVLFSSLTASVAGAGLTAYSCAKAALEHLVRVAAIELGPRNIRVNAVAPGFSDTPMTKPIFDDPALAGLYLDDVPYQARAVTPQEVASTVSWLASSDCFATGEIVQISGGAQLGRLPSARNFKELRKA